MREVKPREVGACTQQQDDSQVGDENPISESWVRAHICQHHGGPKPQGGGLLLEAKARCSQLGFSDPFLRGRGQCQGGLANNKPNA